MEIADFFHKYPQRLLEFTDDAAKIPAAAVSTEKNPRLKELLFGSYQTILWQIMKQ
ncbi:hypothetical protein K4039_01590 [Lyngbya sp. CCAP 1446/10]|uniref:hypothetical protein n=1 Tax=Lyngbya sp. CCAP 1446/10 TaxID=439293 RepID=UPI002238376A|nr:hypothetical protein [Lyngbya sp. CCAP 1446/10]MCW6048803.1 hypothetical protein [Lyngbya sp. CCAP 1446/10]